MPGGRLATLERQLRAMQFVREAEARQGTTIDKQCNIIRVKGGRCEHKVTRYDPSLERCGGHYHAELRKERDAKR